MIYILKSLCKVAVSSTIEHCLLSYKTHISNYSLSNKNSSNTKKKKDMPELNFLITKSKDLMDVISSGIINKELLKICIKLPLI